jgi:peptide/histidine transporter 3/4
MLQSSTTMSVILFMPLYDKIFVPLMRMFTREEKGITVLQPPADRHRHGPLNRDRLHCRIEGSKRLHFVSEVDGANHQLSIFWQLPKYILLGVADVFTVVGMQPGPQHHEDHRHRALPQRLWLRKLPRRSPILC